jgi:hypothetical protein
LARAAAASAPPPDAAKDVAEEVADVGRELLPELAVRDGVPASGVISRPIVVDAEADVDGRYEEQAGRAEATA